MKTFFQQGVVFLKMVNHFVYVQMVERLLSNGSLPAFYGPEVACLGDKKISIWYDTTEIKGCLCQVVQDALLLIDKASPIMREVVQKNLNYICTLNKGGRFLAVFVLSTQSSLLYWKGIAAYSISARPLMLAAVLIHEAYHGECYKVFGFRAYDRRNIERICRRREVRFLRRIIKNNLLCQDELNKRINYLEESGL